MITNNPPKFTEEMVEAGASYAWTKANPFLDWDTRPESVKEVCRFDARNVLVAAFAVDSCSWEPLAEDDPLNVGDEVRVEWTDGDLTTRLSGLFGGYDDNWGHVVTPDGQVLGRRDEGTWHVRHCQS